MAIGDRGTRPPDFELPRTSTETPVESCPASRGRQRNVVAGVSTRWRSARSAAVSCARCVRNFPEVSSDDVELITVSVDSFFTPPCLGGMRRTSSSPCLADFWPHGRGGESSTAGLLTRTGGLATRGTFRHRQERHRPLVTWSTRSRRRVTIADYQKALGPSWRSAGAP